MESNRSDVTDFKSNDVVRDALEAVTFEDISEMVKDYWDFQIDAVFQRQGKNKHRMTESFGDLINQADPGENVLLHPRTKLKQLVKKTGCEDSISGVGFNISEICMNLQERLEDKLGLRIRSVSINEEELEAFPTLNGLLVCARKAVSAAVLNQKKAA